MCKYVHVDEIHEAKCEWLLLEKKWLFLNLDDGSFACIIINDSNYDNLMPKIPTKPLRRCN